MSASGQQSPPSLLGWKTSTLQDSVVVALSAANPPQQRLRLAYVIDCVHDWNLGGTEKQLALMVKALDPRTFEPAIFVMQASEGTRAKALGCPIFFVNENTKVCSRFRSLRNLRAALSRFQPQIVQTFFIDGTFYGVTAAWLNRVPVIVQSRRNAGHWQRPYHTVALRIMNHAVQSWQCNSRCVAEMIQEMENIPADRIDVLYNSIDTDYFLPATAEGRLAARRSLALPLQAPTFVAVSTLRPVKGLATIIDAAAKIQPYLPGAQFLIVGEGPQRKELDAQIARQGLQETVRLVGAQKDVRSWLAAADLGLLASYSESSSNALMEYMSMGLPAVVSDIPANRELVRGVYFLPGNGTELAEQITWLWRQGALRQRLAQEYRRAAVRLGRLTFAQHLQNYYLNLAAKHIPGFANGR